MSFLHTHRQENSTFSSGTEKLWSLKKTTYHEADKKRKKKKKEKDPFAVEHKDQSVEQWKKVVWADKSRATMS